jgi:hypothetical protein
MGVAIGGAILVKGQPEEAIMTAVNAMGKENFTAFKVTEEIGNKNQNYA